MGGCGGRGGDCAIDLHKRHFGLRGADTRRVRTDGSNRPCHLYISKHGQTGAPLSPLTPDSAGSFIPSLRESAGATRLPHGAGVGPDLRVYLESSPPLSSVSESLSARCSFRRSTSSLHSSESSQISNRRRYLTVSWGNAASHGRLLSTGTHTWPDGSFCTRITHLFINGWQKRRLATEI